MSATRTTDGVPEIDGVSDGVSDDVGDTDGDTERDGLCTADNT